jgi:hypothetical protein
MTVKRFRSFRLIFNVSIQAHAATATPAKGDISIKSKRGHFHKVATQLAVNHWANEPMVTADVDVVIAAERVEEAVKVLRAAGFSARKFKWSVNLKGRSRVSVQISTGEDYRDFPARSVPADIHGILMRVASLPDTLRGKVLAWQDTERRASKRQKDLLDILRLVEAHPKLLKSLPADLAKKIAE